MKKQGLSGSFLKLGKFLPFCALILAGQGLALEAGDTAPGFSLPALRKEDGNGATSLADFWGKVVYVDFWASWCPPCLVSIPLLNELRNRYVEAGADFEIVAVNLDSDPEDGIDFLLDDPVQYRVLHDADGTVPAVYGLKAMPTSYLIDRNGTIRLVHEGFKRSDIELIETQVQHLLEEN
jgi:thiol-disulfide isomerase/thioredoxin